MLLLNHLRGHMIHLFYIFSFLFLKFSSPYSPKKKKKKKTLFFSLLVHICCYTFSNFPPPFSPLYLPTTFCFTVTLPSSFYLSYIMTLLLLFYILILLLSILFYIILISFFFHQNIISTLSLSLSLSLYFLLVVFCFFL